MGTICAVIGVVQMADQLWRSTCSLLGLLPVLIHFFQGEISDLIAVLLDGFFHGLKSTNKFFVGQFKGFFGVDIHKPGVVDERKQQVSKPVLHSLRILVPAGL